MSDIYVQEGKVLDFVVPGGGVTQGTPVVIGGTFIIPSVTASATASFAGYVEGVFTLPKTGGVAAYTAGDDCYWDGSVVTKTVTDRFIGKCAKAALIGGTSVQVKVVQTGDPGANNLADHLADTSDAHDASAVSVLDSGNLLTATDVEAALAEICGTGRTTETLKSISDHTADATDAHDASAISVLDSGNLYTATDVEAALAEIAGTGRTTQTVKTNADDIADIRSSYAATFAGNNGAGLINITVLNSGATAAVGDKVIMITGRVTATGAMIAFPQIGAADFDDLIEDNGGNKAVRQINAANWTANDYCAWIVKM